MTRWQQIEEIYHSVVKLTEGERPAFLEKACAGDPVLRQEVETLLRAEQSGERFMEEPVLETAAKTMSQEKPESLIGQQIGSYQIEALLGRGAWEWCTRHVTHV